jgi:hypothetical protein
MAYLLDANVFIQAKNLHYGFDFCPAFWNWLIAQNEAEKVFSIEKVEDEILAVGDELSEWVESLGPAFFLPLDEPTFSALGDVSAWAATEQEQGRRYEQAAIATFLQGADYYLVAQALAGGHTLVTHERASPSQRKIKIPDACIGLHVRFMSPFEMLRRERARFVLGKPS